MIWERLLHENDENDSDWGRFYLHKEAQNAQNAQTVVNFQKFSEDSICTKNILFAQMKFVLHKEIKTNILFAQRLLRPKIEKVLFAKWLFNSDYL